MKSLLKMPMLYTLMLLAALVLHYKPRQKEVDPLTSIYPPGCQIAKSIYKTPTIGRPSKDIVDAEKITLNNGKTVEVSTVSGMDYRYDNLGRIVTVSNKFIDGRYYNYFYSYTGNAIYISEECCPKTNQKATNNSGITILLDTIPLNQRGYQDRLRGSTGAQSQWVYDSDGYLIARSLDLAKQLPNIYEQGNLTRFIYSANSFLRNGQYVFTEDRTHTYKYNLSRANQPKTHQYTGRANRNLPIEEVVEIHNDGAIAEGPVYRKTFAYTFDNRGRVVRRVAYGRALNANWLLEDDYYGVGVTDYEYSCL